MIVFRRWAIVRTVHSANFSRIVSWINKSVLSSRKRKMCCVLSYSTRARTEKKMGRFILGINISSGFIEYKNSIFPQYGSRQADQLTLANAKVAATCQDWRMQSCRTRGHIFQFDLFQCVPKICIMVFLEWIEISAINKLWQISIL